MYVIKRKDGMYVARPNIGASYTNDRQLAAEYRTLEDAKHSACTNESIWKSHITWNEQLIQEATYE